uniref:Ubiquitin carboxyl-terminal hydrolase n=1 Tax=Phallusia mammillata TaxID=59560 RepID=A0A6F9DWL3_9ASCI|nr:ubiquitin carboxyl-terminal hydrolase 46-like [Phallusia mammillata]
MVVELENHEETSLPLIPYVGIQNMGNTCYLNSVLQVLFYCPEFVQRLRQTRLKIQEVCERDQTNFSDEKFNILKELDLLYTDMNSSRNKIVQKLSNNSQELPEPARSVRPTKFMEHFRNENPLFEAYTQQDAQECLHCILNACGNQSLPCSQPKNTEWHEKGQVQKMCGGRKLQSATVMKTSISQNPKDPSTSKHKKIILKRPPASKYASTSPSKSLELLSSSVVSAGCLKHLKRKRIVSSNEPNCDANKENVFGVSRESISTSEPPSKKPCTSQDLLPSSKNAGTKGLNIKGLKGIFAKKKYTLWINSSKKPTGQPLKAICKKTVESQAKAKYSKICTQPVKTNASSDKDNFIQDLFYGQALTTIKCFECETEVHRSEPFQDISLPVKASTTSDDLGPHDLTNDVPTEHEDLSGDLSWALSEYAAQDILDGENKYYCNACCRLTEGGQSVRFKQLPPVLTFHLKRFSTSLDTCNFKTTVSKITSCFKIPPKIDLKQWCVDSSGDETNYELFAIIIHSGSTITGGHYLSFIKDTQSGLLLYLWCIYIEFFVQYMFGLVESDETWLEMDDEDVKVLNNEAIQRALAGDFDNFFTRTPYLLFYHKTK